MKGYWNIIEAVLSGILLVGFLMFISIYAFYGEAGKDVTLRAIRELRALDDQDLLKPYAVANDNETLDSQIQIYGYNHTLQICDQEENCVGTPAKAANVWIGTYYIAGYSRYEPKEIRLYLYKGA